MKNLFVLLLSCCISSFTFAEKNIRGSNYQLDDGQIIGISGNDLQRFNTPCTLPPWNGNPCGNWWQDIPVSTSHRFVCANSDGSAILLDTGSGWGTKVYRYYGQNSCCELILELEHRPLFQPSIIGEFIFYVVQGSDLYKTSLITEQTELVSENFHYKDLATDGVNLFTLGHVINGDCSSNTRYSQIWTVNLQTGDLTDLVCNWRHTCGTVGDAEFFTVSNGYFHISHHDRLMIVDPTPKDSIVYAAEYCNLPAVRSLSAMQTSSSYSADLNCSGNVDIDDLLDFISKFGGTFGPADLNKDGNVDIDDLLILLAQWG